MTLCEREQAALYRIESGMELIGDDARIVAEAYRKLEDEELELYAEAQRAFVVLEETPEPVWEDERDINNRIQEAHDILDTVLMKYFREYVSNTQEVE